MALRTIPPQSVLLQILRYDPESGFLYWRERSADLFSDEARFPDRAAAAWNARYAERRAFTASDRHSYNHGGIFGERYFAHRIIWKLVTGEDPIDIDHINGNPSDNRILNLRSVTHAGNQKNLKKRQDNTSGITGVRWVSQRGKWNAQVHSGGKAFNLGNFNTQEEAIAARKAAEIRHGFHVNHARERPHSAASLNAPVLALCKK